MHDRPRRHARRHRVWRLRRGASARDRPISAVDLERERERPDRSLYRRASTQLQIDDLAVVRPPEDVAAFLADGGYLPRGVPLLKRVLALHDQTVCRIGRTITVDSIAVGDARERDSRGRTLPLWQGCRVIAEGDVFLMNRQSADSFDGRYFGPLPVATVVGCAKPLWIARED